MKSLLVLGGSLTSLFLMQVMREAPDNQESPASAVLVAPMPGVPLSAEQLDNRTCKLPNGTSAVAEVRSKVYRDSSGRLRIEELAAEAASGVSRVLLVDPETGLKVILLPEKKIALRWVVPKFGEEGFTSMGGIGEALPHGKWEVRIEELGNRVTGVVEVEGSRVTHTLEGQPSAARVEERWYSKDLSLIVLAVASGPTWTHTATLKEIAYGDPGKGLFSIPAEYHIQDIRLSTK